MVKKKIHEDGHEHEMPAGEMTDNQEKAEEAIAEQDSTPEEPSASGDAVAKEDLNLKLTEMQDKYLRLSAEFDNYRKRTLREKIELTRSAGEAVLISLLPVVDDFERALVSLRDTENCTAVKEGLHLIYGKISDFLKQNGVREMDVLNKPFDSDVHEAVTNTLVENEEMKGKVVEIVQKGYLLNDKVIRFPKVVVGE